MTGPLDLPIPGGDEVEIKGRIEVIFTAEGFSLNIDGVGPMEMFGAAEVLKAEATMLHMGQRAQAQQQAQQRGLVAARMMPQDHLPRRRS